MGTFRDIQHEISIFIGMNLPNFSNLVNLEEEYQLMFQHVLHTYVAT